MFRILLLTIIVLTIGLTTVQAQEDLPIDTMLNRLVPYGYAGSILMVTGGEVVLDKGYGTANVETGEVFTPDTASGIGSITKLFTRAAILTLVDDGLMSLDAPISTYLDSVPEDKAGITIQQLLDHRAGLETYHDTAGDFQPMTRDEALTTILNTPLIFTPGDTESYSNSGYTLLAILIEEVSGIGYQDYIHQHVIDPLSLTSTTFWGEGIDPIASTPNRSNGYGDASQWDYSWVLVGNGGMVSTTRDLLGFARGMAAGDIFDGELAGLDAIDGEILAAGGGDATDYVGVLVYDSESDSAIIHLTNQFNYDAESVSISIYLAVRGEEELSLPPETLPLNSEQLEPLSGVYSISEGNTIHVEAAENGLLVGASGQDAVNLLTGQSDAQLDAVNTKTQEVIEAAATGDFSLLVGSIGSGSEAELAGLWNGLVAQHGEYEAVTMLGATFNRFGEIDVLFRLNFAAGEQYIRWTWAGDEIVNFEFLETAELTIQYLYLPVESGFATFSLDNPDMPILHFSDDDTLTINDVVLAKE